MVEKISEEQMQQYKNYCTVGDLLVFIINNNIDLESKIFVERIEDKYFEQHHWRVVEKDCFNDGSEVHQYHIAFQPVKYENNTLFLDLHY